MDERDEARIDEVFGRWIQAQRQKAGMNLLQVELVAEISRFRMKQIEAGTMHGASVTECRRLSKLYGLCLAEVLGRAAGTWTDPSPFPPAA